MSVHLSVSVMLSVSLSMCMSVCLIVSLAGIHLYNDACMVYHSSATGHDLIRSIQLLRDCEQNQTGKPPNAAQTTILQILS